MQLQQHLDEFEAAGIRLFAVSYDSVEVLARFAEEHGITFPLLADEGSEVIRRFGILNTLIRPDESVYGIPYPGLYLVGTDGRIEEKVFHQRYQTRDAAQSLLKSRFGFALDLSANPRAEVESPGVRVSATLGERELTFMQLVNLYVRLDLDEGLHVYGRPIPEGFYPTEVTVTAPEGVRVSEPVYPPTRPFRVQGVDDELQVFEGDVEIAVPLSSALREEERATLEVAVSYQACDEVQCFIPQRQLLRLDVPVGRLNRPPRRE